MMSASLAEDLMEQGPQEAAPPRRRRYQQLPAEPYVDINNYLPDNIVHHSQFLDIWCGPGHSPERDLAAATLEAAAVDLQQYRFASGRRRQKMYWEAYDWVVSDDRRWSYSFANICEFLGLSPEATRRRLLP